ncbi:MAG: Tol-Pal system beta propeller repeat protein TolB [bacterium]
MMKRIFYTGKIFFISVIMLLVCLSSNAQARIRIDIYGPELVPFPIAVAPFTYTDGASQFLADQIRSIMVNDLEISGFFDVSGPDSFPPGAMESLKNPDQIDLSPWQMHVSEALVTGGVTVTGDKLEAFFRLFDLVEQSFVTGLKYAAPQEEMRDIAHRIADEITFHLTGQVGVAHTKIAFVTNRNKIKEIYTIDFDGKGLTMLTRHESICLSPAWSTDGKQIAYTCFRRRNPDLYIHNRVTKGFKILSSRPGVNGAPAWSPDGRQIALMMRRDDRTGIAVIDTTRGDNPVFLTTRGGNESSPTWSPDGQMLAFVSDRSGSPQIYTIHANGRELTRITFEGVYNASPAWSPLGDRIAFCGMMNGRFDIYTCKPDGKDIKRLTRDAGNNEDPTWSPDGRFIAFSSDRTGTVHIYCMNANGANIRQLTQSGYEETAPAWSPYFL